MQRLTELYYAPLQLPKYPASGTLTQLVVLWGTVLPLNSVYVTIAHPILKLTLFVKQTSINILHVSIVALSSNAEQAFFLLHLCTRISFLLYYTHTTMLYIMLTSDYAIKQNSISS